MMRISLTLFYVACLLGVLPAQGRFSVANIFGDHMVLQRHMDIPIWGQAFPAEEILIKFNNQTVKATGDANGKWEAKLSSMETGGPFTLLIKSDEEKIEIKNVMIGEVWLASGQSNMRFELKNTESAAEEIPKANYPDIRFFDMKGSAYPSNVVFDREQLTKLEQGEYFEEEGWKMCSPDNVPDFSAVAYHFAKELYDSLQVPIGIIHNAIGGSPTQAWISEKDLKEHASLSSFISNGKEKTWMSSENIHPWLAERASVNLQTWIQEGKPELLNNHPFAPAYLYKTGISPLLPFAIKGVIWYQGESNATHPESHKTLFASLISSWREAWGQGNFPVYFVQLPGISNRNRWPEFRQTQLEALRIPETGMAVIIDAGHPTDVHPRNKKIPGHRLALLALGKSYGYDLLFSGPLFNSYRIDERSVHLTFDHATGLHTKGNAPISGLLIQGYLNGNTEVLREIMEVSIEGNELSFELPHDISLTKIKYGWAPNPSCNLFNGAGLPASPFKIELAGNN